GSKTSDRSHVAVIGGNGMPEPHFGADLERMDAFTPAQRVSIRKQRAICAAVGPLAGGPIHQIAWEERRYDLQWNTVVFRKQRERFFRLLAGFNFLFFGAKAGRSSHVPRRTAKFIFRFPTDAKFIHD